MTIADMVDLLKLGTAIDARRRSAPPANELDILCWQAPEWGLRFYCFTSDRAV